MKKSIIWSISLLCLLIIVCGCYYRYEYVVHSKVLELQNKRKAEKEAKLMNANQLKIESLKSLQDEDGAWYTRYHFIAHGGGGIDGRTYSNSLEALNHSYENGLRVFDIDLTFTSDSVLVMRHSWTENLEQRGQTMSESGGFVDRNGHTQHHVKNPVRLDYETFMNNKIYKLYTPMSCRDMILYMQSHPDIYVATDMKDDAESSYRYLVDMARFMEADSILNRIIANVYEFDVLEKIEKIYHFPFTTARQHYVHPNNYYELAEFCVKNNIHVVNLSSCYVNDDGVKLLMSKGIHVYVAVVDYISDMARLKKMGFSGACTNWLKENDYKGTN